MVGKRATNGESFQMKQNFSDRKFQFWQYRVNHGELLVRSPMDARNPRNIDIMFCGVKYVDLPRQITNLEIDNPTEADMARATERLGKPLKQKNVIVLKSEDRRFLVVASVVKIVESDMDIMASPFE